MKKLFFWFWFILTPFAFGQTTTVSVTVVDSTSQVWANGTISYVFKRNPQFNAPPQYNNAPLPTSYQTPTTIQLDNTGSATFVLPTSTAITPAGSTWSYTVCPNASIVACNTVDIPTTGSTQNISSVINANISPISVSIAPVPIAYSDNSIKTAPSQGGIYYNSITKTPRFWNGSSFQPFGGSAVGAVLLNPSGNQLINQQNGTALSINGILPSLSYSSAAFGDSLTAGQQGDNPGSVPCSLTTLLGLPIFNQGVGGNTSTQIGVRQGGIPTYSASSFTIPTSGGVTVTFPSGYEPVTNQGGNDGFSGCVASNTGGTDGTWAGVHGTVTFSGSTYTFTRTTSGASTPIMTGTQFFVDTPFIGYFNLIETGRNNYGAASQVLSDDAAMITILPQPKRYAVTSVINANTIIGGVYTEACLPTASAICTQIRSLNASKLNANSFGGSNNCTFAGGCYIDTWTPLLNSGNSTLGIDIQDIAAGVVPTSLHASYHGQLKIAVASTDTSFCALGPGVTPGTTGFFSIDGTPFSAGAEYFIITGVGSSCTAGGFTGVVAIIQRGTRGTPASTPASWSINQFWGNFDSIHLCGGASNPGNTKGCGYNIQTAAINSWYTTNASNPLIGANDFGKFFSTSIGGYNILPNIQAIFPGIAQDGTGGLLSTNPITIQGQFNQLKFRGNGGIGTAALGPTPDGNWVQPVAGNGYYNNGKSITTTNGGDVTMQGTPIKFQQSNGSGSANLTPDTDGQNLDLSGGVVCTTANNKCNGMSLVAFVPISSATAPIGTNTLYTVPATPTSGGNYFISCNLTTTTAGTGTGTMTIQATWTDVSNTANTSPLGGSIVLNGIPSNNNIPSSTHIALPAFMAKAGTAIQYTTSFSGSTTGYAYSYSCQLYQMSPS